MRIKTMVLYFLVVIVSNLLSGCYSSCVQKECSTEMHTLTDAAGKSVTLPTKPQRIVSMLIGSDEMLMDLVEPERIAALSYLADDPGISNISDRSSLVKGRLRGYTAESIAKFKPDLVIIADWWQPDVLHTLKDIGISVYIYRSPHTVEEVRGMIEEVAYVVGESERGKKLIGTYDGKLAALKEKTANIGKRKSIVPMSSHGIVGTKGSLFDDMCNFIGIDNCVSRCDFSNSSTISKELLVQMDPDMIILPDWDAPSSGKTYNVQALLNDPALQVMKAVHSKKVRTVGAKSMYTVSHYAADGMNILAEAVYPEVKNP